MWTEQQAAELEYAAAIDGERGLIDPLNPDVWLETAMAFGDDPSNIGYLEFCLERAIELEIARGGAVR